MNRTLDETTPTYYAYGLGENTRALLKNLTASLLLTLYGVIAICGYGLHGLMPCGDPQCVRSAATGSACPSSCCCGCNHADSPFAKRQAERSVAFGGWGEQDHSRCPQPHDSTTCSVCQLLAQISTGHVLVELPALVTDVSGDWIRPIPCVAISFCVHLPDARGPPTA